MQSVLQNPRKNYLSCLKWIFFLFVTLHHALSLPLPNSIILSFMQKMKFYIPLIVDCFFVISGFLITHSFFERPLSRIAFFKKRLISLYPMLLLYWIVFQSVSFLGWIDVNLFIGYRDILGLNVFGIPWHHNHFNYTWFCYALFWSSIFYFSICTFNKIRELFLISMIVISGYILMTHWDSFNLIVPKPFKEIPLSIGTIRALLGVGLGILIGCLSQTFKKRICLNDKTFVMLSFAEILILGFFIGMFPSLSIVQCYFVGLLCFSFILLFLSFENSLFYKLLNHSFWGKQDYMLYGAYLFSAILFLATIQLLIHWSFLKRLGDLVVLWCVLGSLVLGKLCYTFFQKQINTYFEKQPPIVTNKTVK